MRMLLKGAVISVKLKLSHRILLVAVVRGIVGEQIGSSRVQVPWFLLCKAKLALNDNYYIKFTFEARFASRLAKVVAQVLFQTLQRLTNVYRAMFLWDISKVGENDRPTLNLKRGLRAWHHWKRVEKGYSCDAWLADFLFPWNVNLRNYSSCSVTWRFCVTREEREWQTYIRNSEAHYY